MIDYGLKDKVAIVTGANNPWGIGATTALAFAKEGAKVVLVYKRIAREYDKSKTDKNGVDRYFEANSLGADDVEKMLKEINADYLILESDISNENSVKEIYQEVIKKYGKVDILVNNAADGDMDGIDTIEKITKEIIDKHKSAGETLFIVSASPENWIRPWAMKNGFTEVIATKLEEKDGMLTGKFASRNCYGVEKVNRLKEFFTDREQVYLSAYGDSSGDEPMLNYANHGVLIK